MGRNGQATRKRGVRASRARLNAALIAAGLRTQNALAERIAELEDLEAAPRDLVNRVFREQPVEPASLERIARVLGVAAHTLYLTSAEAASATGALVRAGDAVRPIGRRRRRAAWFALAGVLAAIVIGVGVIWNLPAGSPLGCRARVFLHPPHTAPGRLGILVARFAHDPGNVAQYFLATNFINDARLDPYVSVVTLCRGLSLDGPGDLGARRARLRAQGRTWLRRSGAAMLIWGRVEGKRLLVRFISTRRAAAAVTLTIGGRPLPIEESQLQIPLVLNQSAAAMPDVKRAALELMDLPVSGEVTLRNRAVHAYTFSSNWLRAAIVGGENLRRSIDAKLDPRRWAIVNAGLCYEYRLLGDYDGKAANFRDAASACQAVIRVSPRAEFPLQWSSAQTNLASAYVRLQRYAKSAADSAGLLHRAEQSLLAAGAVARQHKDRQQQVLAQRNLGTVYIRLAELATGPRSDHYFRRAVTLTQTALASLNPALQPLDWAITRQNLCLARHEWGKRKGAAGIGLVKQAVDDCRAALHWLSRARAPLDWAMAQNNLAISEATLAQMQGDKASLTAAIADFKQAQTVYTRATLPANWAMVEINLGELYCHLARLGGNHAVFEPAVAHSDQALEVFMTKKITRYQRYAERQLTTVEACQAGKTAQCKCGGG